MIPGSLWSNQLKKPQVFEIFLGPEMSSISWLYFSLESKKSSKPTIFLFQAQLYLQFYQFKSFSTPKVFQQKDTPKVPFFLFVDTPFLKVFLSPWRWMSFPGVAGIVGSWCWKLLGGVSEFGDGINYVACLVLWGGDETQQRECADFKFICI